MYACPGRFLEPRWQVPASSNAACGLASTLIDPARANLAALDRTVVVRSCAIWCGHPAAAGGEEIRSSREVVGSS